MKAFLILSSSWVLVWPFKPVSLLAATALQVYLFLKCLNFFLLVALWEKVCLKQLDQCCTAQMLFEVQWAYWFQHCSCCQSFRCKNAICVHCWAHCFLNFLEWKCHFLDAGVMICLILHFFNIFIHPEQFLRRVNLGLSHSTFFFWRKTNLNYLLR